MHIQKELIIDRLFLVMVTSPTCGSCTGTESSFSVIGSDVRVSLPATTAFLSTLNQRDLWLRAQAGVGGKNLRLLQTPAPVLGMTGTIAGKYKD